MERRTFVLGVAAAALAGCSGGSEAADDDEPGTTTTRGETTTTPAPRPTVQAGRRDLALEQDGVTREFIVYAPQAAIDAAAVPVEYMLHGTSGDGPRFFDGSGWRELADAEGIVTVYPSALDLCFFEDENRDGDFDDAAEAKATSKWDAGQFEQANFRPCTPEDLAARPPGQQANLEPVPVDDVEFIRRIHEEHVAVDYAVDPDRVYVSGFSNGGQMSARLAVDLDEIFASVAVAAGTISVAPDLADHPLSLAYSVGSVDDRFTGVNGGAPLPLDETLLDIPFFRSQVDLFLTLTGLADEFTHEVRRVGRTQVGQFVFATAAAGGAAPNELRVAVIGGLGHSYPDEMPPVLWEFFQGHPRS